MTNSDRTNFDVDHYYELLRSAYYEIGNFSDVYKYASIIIENSRSNREYEAWTYKGISYALLSDPQNPQIKEMNNYLRESEQYLPEEGLLPQQNDTIMTSASYATYQCVKRYLSFLAEEQIRYSEGKILTSPPTYVTKEVSTTIGLNIGAQLGNAYGNYLTGQHRKAEFTVNSGEVFISTFVSDIMEALTYCWARSNCEAVANNIYATILLIVETQVISGKAVQLFLEQVTPLQKTIHEKFSNIPIHVWNNDIPRCPKCGYPNPIPHRGILRDLFELRNYKPVKPGEKASCYACGYEWKYQMSNK